MIDIYITSWRRIEFLKKTIKSIYDNTTPGTYRLHVFDNASDPFLRGFLIQLFNEKKICTLHLDSRNTGCLYNKAIFHEMTESGSKYYVVTDNDIYPPRLTPDWLEQMVKIMDEHEDLAFLAPQLPPIWLQEPIKAEKNVVYCKAVGNTLKIVRRKAYPIEEYAQKTNKYGDDGLVCEKVRQKGWRVAFCRDIFCFHAGQCENWGYEENEIALDPRKQGYGEPFYYEISDMETYRPKNENLIYREV